MMLAGYSNVAYLRSMVSVIYFWLALYVLVPISRAGDNSYRPSAMLQMVLPN